MKRVLSLFIMSVLVFVLSACNSEDSHRQAPKASHDLGVTSQDIEKQACCKGCEAGQSCVDCKCVGEVQKAGECSEDCTERDGMVCHNGKCVPKGSCEISPCTPDSRCVNHKCEKLSCGEACADGMVCHNGKCVPKGSCEISPCTPDSRCVNHKCEKLSCGEACADGMVCHKGKCVPKGSCEISPCTPDSRCVNHKCERL